MSPRTETRERVLRAALRTLADDGFAATSARAIARRGGFAPGVIYYHFDDLEDLLVATMGYTSEQRIARYTERTSAVGGFADLVATLRELATAAVAYYMGIETLSHLDGDRHRPDAVFEAAARTAAMVDTLRNISGS